MKTADEVWLDLLLFEKTGFTDVNAISWKNVAKPLCLDAIRKTREQAQKDFEKILDERFEWWAMNNVFRIKQWKMLKKELKAKLKQMGEKT